MPSVRLLRKKKPMHMHINSLNIILGKLTNFKIAEIHIIFYGEFLARKFPTVIKF